MTRDEARITIQGVPDKPGSSSTIFKLMAEKKITVDMIVQNIAQDDRADISFTVPKEELPLAAATVASAVQEVGANGFTQDDNVSKISVVGLGMENQSGVAEKMFRAISAAGINIQMITTSEIKISVLVPREKAQAGLRAVHQVFELHTRPKDAVTWESLPERSPTQADLDKLVADLQKADMEQLSLNDIALSDDQARITLVGVPDSPGIAATVFEAVAEVGIVVDMIIQSYEGTGGETGISFTMPRSQFSAAQAVAEELKEQYSISRVLCSQDIAKLSVSGIGLRSHTSVAIGMFEVLAAEGINVEMINTSELRVNVVVKSEFGGKALKCLTKKFAENLV